MSHVSPPARDPAPLSHRTLWNARSNSTRQLYRDISFDQLRAIILDGELTEVDWVQRESDPTWVEIGAVPELADAIPAFTFRHNRASDGETEDMDMTPMIDIVFQLLLFFLIISTFQVQKAIGFPDAGEPKESQNIPTLGQLGRDRVLISVDAQNRFELLHYDTAGALKNREPLERDKMVERLQQISRDERKTAVVIQASDQAKHESIVAVIDAATQANMQDIRIAQPVGGGASEPGESPGSSAPEQRAPRRVEDQ